MIVNPKISSTDIAAELAYRARSNPLIAHHNLPIQQQFTDDLAKTKLLFGGNRSGKSETVAQYIVRKCLKQKMRYWACGVTFSDSVNIQQSKIYRFIPLHETKYCRYNEITGFSNRKLLFKNGSVIIFKSYDQGPDSFQGDSCDGIWLDEEPPYEIYKECRMRLVDRSGEMLMSMTSLKGVTQLIEEVFDGYNAVKTDLAPLINQYVPRIAEKRGIKLYFLWSTENPFIDQQRLLEDVGMMNKQEITCRIYGIPINLTGRIYPQFNQNIHVIDRNDIDISDCQLWNVLDPHDRKPWAIAWFAVSKTGHAVCIHEYPEGRNFNEMMFDDKTYDDYSVEIKRIEAALLQECRNKFIKRVIDPNFGNKTMQLAERQGGQSKTTPREELKKRGLIYIDGIDALEAGHIQVREWIHWREKDGQIIVSPKLIIASNCQNTIRHLTRYSRKDIQGHDGDVKDKVGVREEFKDFSDLVRYFTMANPRYMHQQMFVSNEDKKY